MSYFSFSDDNLKSLLFTKKQVLDKFKHWKKFNLLDEFKVYKDFSDYEYTNEALIELLESHIKHMEESINLVQEEILRRDI